MQEILNAGSIGKKPKRNRKKDCINRCWINKVFLLGCQLQVWTCANGKGGFLPSFCGSTTGCGVFIIISKKYWIIIAGSNLSQCVEIWCSEVFFEMGQCPANIEPLYLNVDKWSKTLNSYCQVRDGRWFAPGCWWRSLFITIQRPPLF